MSYKHTTEDVKKSLYELIEREGLDNALEEIAAHYSMYWDLVDHFNKFNKKWYDNRLKEMHLNIHEEEFKEVYN